MPWVHSDSAVVKWLVRGGRRSRCVHLCAIVLPKILLPKKLSKKIARFSTQKIDPATGVNLGRILMKFFAIPTSLLKYFRTNIVAREPQLFLMKIRTWWKFPDIPIQSSFDMAHFEVRGKGHFEVRGKLPPCAIHGMVDQRWKTIRDQRRVQRRILDKIIQAHTYADLRYAWSVSKYSVCSKRPFFERPSIVHPRWICGDGEKDACCVGVSH